MDFEQQCKNLKLDKEDAVLLKKLLNKPLKELYAIHYIYSRMGLCSWHYVPDKDDPIYVSTAEEWVKTYKEKIKDKLTDEIIDAICRCDYVGSDLIEVGTKGYNLCKIFNYCSTEGTWDGYPAYYEVKEKPISKCTPFDYISYLYEKSILPYICGGSGK